MSTYRPRKSSAQWLEGAPATVLAVYDNGGRSCDRYTVLYGAPLWTPEYGRNVPARAMSSNPFHPQGVGMYVEVPAWSRSQYGKKIRFQDLPNDCKRCVVMDCEPSTPKE